MGYFLNTDRNSMIDCREDTKSNLQHVQGDRQPLPASAKTVVVRCTRRESVRQLLSRCVSSYERQVEEAGSRPVR